MPRVTVPAAEAIIGQEFPCLNKGHVQLVDYMGGDQSVVQAARVSYARDLDVFDDIKDRALISYLMAHRHTTPFEMVQIKVRIKAPVFVFRQLFRHRTSSINEQSARYTQLDSDFYVPELKDIQPQSADNKQGRSGEFSEGEQLGHQINFQQEQADAYGDYEMRLGDNVAKELARINLPLSIYSSCYWDQNLWNMLHLLGLRMDSHAQYEIRVYANALYEIVKAVAPLSLAAWEEYVYRGARFSRTEMQILQPEATGSGWNWKQEFLVAKLGKRGADEFLAKMNADYIN